MEKVFIIDVYPKDIRYFTKKTFVVVNDNMQDAFNEAKKRACKLFDFENEDEIRIVVLEKELPVENLVIPQYWRQDEPDDETAELKNLLDK